MLNQVFTPQSSSSKVQIVNFQVQVHKETYLSLTRPGLKSWCWKYNSSTVLIIFGLITPDNQTQYCHYFSCLKMLLLTCYSFIQCTKYILASYFIYST